MRKRIVTALMCVCAVFLLCQSDLHSQSGQTVPAVPGQAQEIIQLNIFRCHNQDEGGCDEPYIWVIYFKVDGQTVDLTNLSTLARSSATIYIPHRTITDHKVHPPKTTVIGSHNNLGKTCVKTGDNFAIPEELGFTRFTHLVPIKGLGTNKFALVGVIVYALEEDDASEGNAEGYREWVTRRIIDELNKAIRSLPLNPNPNAIKETIGHRIWQEMEKTHYAPTDFPDSVGDIFIGVDDDTFIGAKIVIKTYKDFETQESIPFTLQFQGKTAYYAIEGTMNCKVPKAAPAPVETPTVTPAPGKTPTPTPPPPVTPVPPVPPGETTTTVICPCPYDIKSPTGCISGRVTNAAGQPRAGKKVILKMAGAERQRVNTDSAGCYQFTNLVDGTYEVKLKKSECGQVRERIDITDGAKVNDVNLKCQ
ncbi:MAG TPA: carboxypeptidase-like regulatory domain-containing protein [Candidatus Brocadiia bacterium]|nr:carboxypeptidase-like regulatory domain-containing protein [Candidatus Brocadiales bacterium]